MTGDTTASGPGAVAIHGNVRDATFILGATAEASAPRFSPLHQLPPDLPDFTGRAADLQRLLAALDRESGGAAAVTAIRGMGGIGKTTLAVHAARRLVARYPDAQILVNLQGHSEAPSLTPVEAMAQVVRAFHPETPPVDDPAQMQALYRSVLAGKRALILLDNAADAAQVRDLVPPSPCGLIVTARDPIPLPGATRLELHELARPESLALLRSAAGRDDVTEAEWDTIAALCADLPLALRVAGSFLAEAIDWTAADCIRDLSDERTRPDRLTLDGLPDTGVAAVLGLSARRLAQSNPTLAARWQDLSVFPADFDPRAAAAVWRVEEDEAKRTLTTLLGRSLVLFDTDERRYRLHDLMRPVAARVFAVAGVEDPEPGSEGRLFGANLRHAEHFCNVLGEADDLFLKGHDGVLQGLRLYDREAKNITTAAAWVRENAKEGHPATILANQFPNAGVYVLSLRLHQREWIVWLEAG
ncbi:MAG TPA: NB-ARC domain-containing protein, partial [Azospirillum sp.]